MTNIHIIPQYLISCMYQKMNKKMIRMYYKSFNYFVNDLLPNSSMQAKIIMKGCSKLCFINTKFNIPYIGKLDYIRLSTILKSCKIHQEYQRR